MIKIPCGQLFSLICYSIQFIVTVSSEWEAIVKYVCIIESATPLLISLLHRGIKAIHRIWNILLQVIVHRRGRRYTRFNNTVKYTHPGNPRGEKLWHKMLSFFLCKEYIYKLYIRRIKFKQTNKINWCPFSSVSKHQWISPYHLLCITTTTILPVLATLMSTWHKL